METSVLQTDIYYYAGISVSVGLQHTYYSISEDGSMVQVCLEVASRGVAVRSISMDYTTFDGSAKGTKSHT